MSLSVDIQQRLGDFALNANFEAPAGITVLFGRSGAGKSAIIRAVAGLSRPDAGRIALDDQVLFDRDAGRHLPPHRRHLGMVFQDGRLFPHLSVRQNLAYGGWVTGQRPGRAQWDRVVDMLGIGPLLDRRPAKLSGGEKQRVAIGRALLAAPRLILADEPLAALDDGRKAEILPYFERLRDEVAIPILYVSHAAPEVARLATTVIALDAGRVTAQGPALDVLGNPDVTPVGPTSMGAVLETTVRRHHGDGLSELDAGGVSLFLPTVPHAPGHRIRVRIAAHDVILSTAPPVGLSALNIVPATVEAIHPTGPAGATVALSTPAGRILARVTRRSINALGLTPGAPCHGVIKSVAIAAADIGADFDRDSRG